MFKQCENDTAAVIAPKHSSVIAAYYEGIAHPVLLRSCGFSIEEAENSQRLLEGLLFGPAIHRLPYCGESCVDREPSDPNFRGEFVRVEFQYCTSI